MPSKSPARNPYPVPDVSTEGYWHPSGPVLGEKVSERSKDWAVRLEPHERLFAHHTLTSVRRDHRLIRPKVPKDALDLALSATYVHNEDTMVPKPYVSIQPETLNWDTWRVLRNELRPLKPVVSAAIKARGRQREIQKTRSAGKTSAESKIAAQHGKRKDTGSVKRKGQARVQDDILDKEKRRLTYAARMMAIERIHPSSLKLAIDGPHSDQTNPGYSRKIDGTFYSI